jgi:minor extracellular serine protease Vpr
MRKLICAFTLLSLFAAGTSMAQQAAGAKLSPLTKKYMHDIDKSKQSLQHGYIYNKDARGNILVSALIKVADAALAQDGLNTLNAKVGTKAGAVWTVKVPVENISSFTALQGISYIQLDEPVYPNLNIARKTTRVDSVHGGYGLPMGYSGKDVVVGVIDFGFDYNHPTFYDTMRAGYRIKQVWQMNGTAAPPTGYSYGKEITDTNAIKAEGTDNSNEFHGTSTTGMAAGSGFGSNATDSRLFRGMAYDADIVLVGVRRDSIGGEWIQGSFSDFLDGVNYIFNYAASVGKPAVVNISWGSQSGSHDGTSLFNQACNSLSGPGKIVVMSAGNEGQEKIHLSKTFTPTDTVINTFLTFTPSTYKRTWVDIWGQPAKTFCAKATLYSGGVAGATTGYQCITNSVNDMYLIGANGLDTCYVEFISASAEPNGKPRITVNIFNKATDSVGISVNGTDGSIDMWDEYYYYGFPHQFQSAFDSLGNPWAVSGNTISTVSDMGSATSVLLVGAYASKTDYTDINGHNLTYSGYVSSYRLVPFSSRGPMIDGRISPDITAPGLTIATSMSSYDTSYTATGSNSNGVVRKYTDPVVSRDFYYCEFSGTSAAAPAASGIVALMLQANPTLTPDQAKTIIFETAITDVYTGTIPAAGNNNWGHGKINAYKALKRVVHDVSVYSFSGQKLDCTLFPNPNDGSFFIDYTGDKNEALTVSVFNTQGSLAHMQQWNVTPGMNRTSCKLPQLAKGIYIVTVASKTGSVNIRIILK